MDSQSALAKIKEAEKKAYEIIEEAKKASHNILHNALLEKEQLITHTKEQAKLDGQKLRAKIEDEAHKEAESIENQAKIDMEKLKEKSGARLEKALEFLKAKVNPVRKDGALTPPFL